MASQMPWFRVYSEILDDRKIKRISKNTGQSKALVIGVWITILSLANKSIERGKLVISDDMPYSIDDIEDETGIPREIIAQLLDEFRAMKMISGNTTMEITNWNKRQYRSDDVSQRVKKHREKQKELQDETFQERSGNVIDTDTDTESYTDPDPESDTTTSSSQDFGELCRAYEHNVGILTPMTAEMLEDDLDTYGLQTCLDAILVAVGQNKRKWAYVRGIMKNWWADGRGPGKPQARAPTVQRIVLSTGEIVEATA